MPNGGGEPSAEGADSEKPMVEMPDEEVRTEQVRVVTPAGVVMAASRPSGVAGLALAGAPLGEGWRLVHVPSGMPVSRAAHHDDPGVLRAVALRLGPLADWTRPAIPLPGPVLRRCIEDALAAEDPSMAQERPPAPPQAPSPSAPRTSPAATARASSASAPRTPPPTGLDEDRDLLVRIVRRLHTAVSPRTFAEVIGELDAVERARLRALLTEGVVGAPAVVGALRKPPSARPAERPGAEREEAGPDVVAG